MVKYVQYKNTIYKLIAENEVAYCLEMVEDGMHYHLTPKKDRVIYVPKDDPHLTFYKTLINPKEKRCGDPVPFEYNEYWENVRKAEKD
jgi:hypothetical protein